LANVPIARSEVSPPSNGAAFSSMPNSVAPAQVPSIPPTPGRKMRERVVTMPPALPYMTMTAPAVVVPSGQRAPVAPIARSS
jgi:hypothetical protein